ncbi:MAG: phosphoribosylpyrophosphate synthetase [Bacteroidetes bacterium]|nr:phosphoribosylpyrophosphate synthetase [Bacteroidota bacterium]
MKTYDTLQEAVAEWQKQGYTHNFNVQDAQLTAAEHGEVLLPEDFHIEAVLRFEGDADPDVQDVLYVLASDRLQMRGLLVNAFGVYADAETEHIISRLNWRPGVNTPPH